MLSHLPSSPMVLSTLSLEGVEKMEISSCPKPCLQPTVECFRKSFPSSRVLKAAHVVPSQVSIVPASRVPTLRDSNAPLELDGYPSVASMLDMSRPSLSDVIKLTLEGRTDLGDYELKNIPELCAVLCNLNIRGRASVTNAGVSVFMLRCAKLYSLVVCDTYFGCNSIMALTSVPKIHHFTAQQIEKDPLKSLVFSP
ncbi:hypothetical protein U1Q18_030326 [Sarracenia purpurea var. burkii]